LSAARVLARAGLNVTVIEARNRVGGRVWTLRSFADDLHGELGGEFIDADQNDIRALCAELGLPLIRILRTGFVHRFRGDDGRYRLNRRRLWRDLAQWLAPLLAAYKHAQGEVSSYAVREMAAISLREWLRRGHARPEVHSMADALRGFFLADPDDLSVLPVVEQLATGGTPAQSPVYRVAGGTDALAAAMANTLVAPVMLQHRLRAIAQSAVGVTATVDDASGRQQLLQADAMVVTLPASTLREIDIRPPLPDDQSRAIRMLRYGCATKALLQLDHRPFAGRVARAFATDSHLGAFWDGSEEQPTTMHSLVTFLAGGSASRALADRVAAGAQRLASDLCWLGIAEPHAGAAHACTWEDDPWARGGYAFLDPTFDPALRDQLSKRMGRLVFAGEHTSRRWQGYMNGAVESGLRAARELVGGN
jgi:monoamine oxidase